MKIQIKDADHNFHLTLPTKLIFSKFVLRMVLKHSGVKGLSPEGTDRLIAELKRIKKRHGAWELVQVQSADGENVTITL